MTCRTAERWMSDEMDGCLPEHRRARLAAHIEKCRDCRLYRTRLGIVGKESGKNMPPVLGQGYWEDFEARLRSRLESVAVAPIQTVAPVRTLRPAWRWVWAGATVTVLAVLAILVQPPRRPPDVFLAFYPGEAVVFFENEMTGNPVMQENFNRILTDSIEEAVRDSEAEGDGVLWDDPLFWESLSLEEMEMIEADLMGENGR
ncbi:MAG: zf-HC2 domain-containing protein [Acidobacteriota bacterium]|nr:zf-HC2 domain-containing protein [Acidobacteriota bacterium]